jgi:hypothetical protein
VLWLVIIMALAIPLAVVVLDSPPMRAFAEKQRREGLPEVATAELKELKQKVETLEAELEAMNHELGQVKETQDFIQKRLEPPKPQG